MSKIDKMLGEGEQIILSATQSRVMPGGSHTTPDDIYVTNRRVILRNPRALGLKTDITDFSYTDLANVVMHKGMFTTEVELIPRFQGDKVKIKALKHKIAEQLCGEIRRGIAGEFGMMVQQQHVQVLQQQLTEGPIEKLQKLAVLKEKGMISDKEFEKAKERLLGEI